MSVRFQENDLSLNVPISWVPLATAAEDDQLFPILKPSDVVNYLCQSENFEKLFGEEPLETIQPVLLEFWSRFAKRSSGPPSFFRKPSWASLIVKVSANYGPW